MRLRPVIQNPSIAPEHVINAVQPYFPWIAPWTIRVSVGLTSVIGNLLSEIQDILGDKPELDFFRIVEELTNDVDEIYKRKICVFIESTTKIEERNKALHHAIGQAITASLSTCHICGEALKIKNVHDEDELILYPFLKRPDESEYRSGIMSVCMSCAEKQWKKKQQDQDSLHKDSVEIDKKTCLTENAGVESTESVVEEVTDKLAEEVAVVENSSHTVSMYSEADINQLELNYKNASKDQSMRIKGLVKRLREGNPNKKLVTINDGWREFCEDLAMKFPNFSGVVDFLRNQLALSSEAGDGVLRLPPFLLLGSPGVGKTEFMLTVSDYLKTRLEIIDIASAQTGTALTGSEAYWGNTQTGVLFNTLVFGDVANPIFMLDEVDKARTAGDYKPLAALHPLLEPRQAKRFHDLSIAELTLDASHVIWIATANSLESIEKSIVDRFIVFTIEHPSKEQMLAIVTNQYTRFIEQHPSGGFFEKEVRPDVLAELCNYHPRKVRKMIEQSFGLAAYYKRRYLIVNDVFESDTVKEKRKNGIGFMSNNF
jgi:ATP-dependent Lon protease